jgi:hypothetical protein
MNQTDSSFPSSVVDLAMLGKLFEEQRPKLLAMVQRRLDPGLAARLSAEDILSDAFLEARRKWPAFKAQPAPTPYAWLYRIVRDCLIEAWRRESQACRNPDRELPWPERSSLQLVLGLVGSGSSPSESGMTGSMLRTCAGNPARAPSYFASPMARPCNSSRHRTTGLPCGCGTSTSSSKSANSRWRISHPRKTGISGMILPWPCPPTDHWSPPQR